MVICFIVGGYLCFGDDGDFFIFKYVVYMFGDVGVKGGDEGFVGFEQGYLGVELGEYLGEFQFDEFVVYDDEL